ncbi:MAG: hypothetical protein ACI9JD_004418, partial [Rhodococcus sp. (in: high G+C Gram-positive bacteria)]
PDEFDLGAGERSFRKRPPRRLPRAPAQLPERLQDIIRKPVICSDFIHTSQ